MPATLADFQRQFVGRALGTVGRCGSAIRKATGWQGLWRDLQTTEGCDAASPGAWCRGRGGSGEASKPQALLHWLLWEKGATWGHVALQPGELWLGLESFERAW